MDPEKLSEEGLREEGEAPSSAPQEEGRPSYRPYSKKTRILAWLGIVFMIFLVIMYTYSLASGKIMEW